MREDDWKIHTLMGNDLTGWEWEDERCLRAVYRKDGVVVDEFFDTWDIPNYSTTWEGAGLVMDWLMNNEMRTTLESYDEDRKYVVRIFKGKKGSMFEEVYGGIADTFHLALCKAYISAMEERK